MAVGGGDATGAGATDGAAGGLSTYATDDWQVPVGSSAALALVVAAVTYLRSGAAAHWHAAPRRPAPPGPAPPATG